MVINAHNYTSFTFESALHKDQHSPILKVILSGNQVWLLFLTILGLIINGNWAFNHFLIISLLIEETYHQKDFKPY